MEEDKPEFELIDTRTPREEEPEVCNLDDETCEACGS